MEAEVERLTELKTSRLKEIMMKRRKELEDICKNAHIEPDVSTAPEQTNALIDSGSILCILLKYNLHLWLFSYKLRLSCHVPFRHYSPFRASGKYRITNIESKGRVTKSKRYYGKDK